jgi:hypothetical protein
MINKWASEWVSEWEWVCMSGQNDEKNSNAVLNQGRKFVRKCCRCRSEPCPLYLIFPSLMRSVALRLISSYNRALML